MRVSPLTGSSVLRKVFAQTVSRRKQRLRELWVRRGGLSVCLCRSREVREVSTWLHVPCIRAWAEAGGPKGPLSCRGPVPNLSYDLGGTGC